MPLGSPHSAAVLTAVSHSVCSSQSRCRCSLSKGRAAWSQCWIVIGWATFRNRQTDLVHLRLLQSFPPVCFKDPLDSCNIFILKTVQVGAGHSGSLKEINARISQTDIVSFSPPNPNHPPSCVCMPQHILYCVYVCVLHAHTHTVSDLCATGDHDCEQVCISSPGSYKCACKDGFTLMDDGRSCSGECLCMKVFVQVRSLCSWSNAHCCVSDITSLQQLCDRCGVSDRWL